MLVSGLIFGWSQSAFSDEPHLQLAPIQFISTVGGNIGYYYQVYAVGSKRTTQQSLGGDVNYNVAARSYLWQPWFSRVTGSVGIGLSSAIASSSESPNTRTDSTVLTGEAILNILPYSRFPFEAKAYRINSQAGGFLSGINSSYIKSGVGISQNYRSLDGRLNGLAGYGHTTGRRGGFPVEEITDQLNLFLTTQPLSSHNTFTVVGAMNNINHPLRRDTFSTDTLVANHQYQPDSVVAVSNMLNLIKASYTFTPILGAQNKSDFHSQQFSSFASWRPEGSPLTLTSSARLINSTSQRTGSADSQFNDTNLNLGANYAWSRLLRMYGSVTINDNSGIQTISTAAGLSAQKGFGELESIKLGGFRYDRYFGASLGNQTTTISNKNQTTTTSVQQLGGNIGHGLSKTTTLDNGHFTINLTQALSTILSTAGSPSTHFDNNGALIWSRTEGRETSMVSLRAADSRTLSQPQNFFQYINLQASRNERLARNQSLIGNLTFQVSRSGAKGVSTPFAASSSGDLTYRHERLFQVKNLSFESALRVQGREIELSKNTAAQQDLGSQSHTSVSWDNNLDYFIGRLKIRLLTRILAVNNVTQSSLIFSMNRSF